MIFSALCWTIWKHRNDLIFHKRIKVTATSWLPEDINAIPLRVWDPNDHQIITYQDMDGVEPPLLLEGDTAVPADGEAGVPAQDARMMSKFQFCTNPVLGSYYLSPVVGGLALDCFSITVFWWLVKCCAFIFCSMLSWACLLLIC